MRPWKDCGECGGEGYFIVDHETGDTRDCPQCAKHFEAIDKLMRVMLMFKNVAGKADNMYADRYREACEAEAAIWLESLNPARTINIELDHDEAYDDNLRKAFGLDKCRMPECNKPSVVFRHACPMCREHAEADEVREAHRPLWTGVEVAGMIKESHRTVEGIRVITDLEIDSISLVDHPDHRIKS